MNWSKTTPFGLLAETMSKKFQSELGMGLTEDSKRFLAQIAFRTPNIDNYDNLSLNWDQFNGKCHPDNRFTLWEWFYYITKLLTNYLAHLWAEYKIIGFISRKDAESLLINTTPGTFLLRFSNSKLGSITVNYLSETGKVISIEPYDASDIKSISLVNRIRDIKVLTHLYPNTPKDVAFGKYYTWPSASSGYVTLDLAFTPR